MLTAIITYPVKGLQGVAAASAMIEPRGLAGDRRWMVVDPAGRFLTRRELPDMALIAARQTADGVTLSHRALGDCAAAWPDADAQEIAAVVWRDTVTLRLADTSAADFLSTALGRPVRLAWQHDASRRAVRSPSAASDDHVSLADGFPLLVTTEASLAALNDRLAQPVTMARFRANLVIAGGGEAWAEDRWRRIRIGDVVLRLDSASARCVVVTQDPATGERRDGDEPLVTLRTLGRRTRRGVTFGQNAIPERLGELRVGDPVEVLEEGDSNLEPLS